MRIVVGYETTYAYEREMRSAVQLIRMTPRRHDGQRIGRWRVSVDADGRLRKSEDGFGNVTHTFYLSKPTQKVRILVEGEAEVADTAGVVAGAAEPFPPQAFLQGTPLTLADAAIRGLGMEAAAEEADPIARLHALVRRLRAAMAYDGEGTGPTTTAAETLALGHGVCQDMTHVFISAARTIGVPARYVSGHLVRADGQVDQEAAHAWAEAHVEGLGWIGFDPANGISPTDAHLRVAVGLDYLSAAPVRGSRTGGGDETMAVRLKVADAARQSQG